MAAEFAASIREGRPSRTDGEAGLRVLAVLEAATNSLHAAGAAMHIAEDRIPVATN